jgi:hypothetical protein
MEETSTALVKRRPRRVSNPANSFGNRPAPNFEEEPPQLAASIAMSWWSDAEIEWSEEETDNPPRADNFYKPEKWTKDDAKVDRLPYAGNNLDKARKLFTEAIKHPPRVRLTIRQRTRVLEQWPKEHEGLSHSLPGRITRRAEKYA